MYTLEEIAALRREIEARGLEVHELWGMLTDEDLQQWCNGCGPQNAPEIVRRGLTGMLQRYRTAFVVHDIDYMFAAKEEADSRMKRNMLTIWAQDFGFWRYLSKPGLLNRIVVIPVTYQAVSICGKEAYLEAQNVGKGKMDG
jgi:hypothetical protein